jgi:hypothetical protein
MNFYYDPILGLQYDYLGDLFLINLDNLPQNLFPKEYLDLWQQKGTFFFDSVRYQTIEPILKITNYKL